MLDCEDICCVVVEALTWFSNGVKLKTSLEAVNVCGSYSVLSCLRTEMKKGLAHWQVCFQLL